MSRYTGSIFSKARRLGTSILESNKEFSKGKKRTTIPGQHGGKRVGSPSEYKLQLTEKQKVAYTYGLTDKQLRRFVLMAKKMKGSNVTNLFILLESRLDNLVFRMGFAPTRAAARQLVNHGHVFVDGKKVDIPSCVVEVGSEITIKEKSKQLNIVNSTSSKMGLKEFVQVDQNAKVGKYVRVPTKEDVNNNIKESFVIEYYNKLI